MTTFHSPSSLRAAIQLALLLLVITAGCSSFNCTRFEQLAGNETDLISFSYSIAEDLTATAHPPLMQGNPEMPILVTTFVDNNNLEKTSKFGRTVQEHISSRLVQLGYAVKEIKLTSQLTIEPQSGESILSREIEKLSTSVNSQAILVGTTSITNRTMYLSARLIDPAHHTIIASTDSRLCMDDTLLSMFSLQRQNNSDEIAEPPRPFLNSVLY